VVAAAEQKVGLLHPSDRAAERRIRERVVEAVGRSLGDGRLLAPGPQEEERVRAIIDEEVAAHERRAVTTNTPLLLDAEGVRRRLFDSVFGLGILQPLMNDPRVEEIIVNGPLRVFTIRDGRKEQAHGVYFENDEELRQLVKRVVSSAGRRLDEASPMVDVRLRDGSRLNAAIAPASTRWTCVTIRKFVLRAHSLDQLVELGALSSAAGEFLDAAVQAGVNILGLRTRRPV
jgi:pilus assembly protein CpaF